MSDEVKRRLVHVSGTAVPVAYLLDLVTWGQLQLFLIGASLVALGLEFVRLFVGLDWAIYDELTREYERDNLAGYALYMFGMTIVALVFDAQVAVPAILMLTIADPISGLLGAGQLRPVKRGSILLVTFGICIFIASMFVPPHAAVLGAVVATLADGAKPVISGYVIDDNITIPIGAAVAMFVGLQYLSEIGF